MGRARLRLSNSQQDYRKAIPMFLLFGFKTVLKALPGKPATCRNCHSFVHHHFEERASKFTLFFIPVFTTSKSYQITCTNCGYVSRISAREKRALELQR